MDKKEKKEILSFLRQKRIFDLVKFILFVLIFVNIFGFYQDYKEQEEIKRQQEVLIAKKNEARQQEISIAEKNEAQVKIESINPLSMVDNILPTIPPLESLEKDFKELEEQETMVLEPKMLFEYKAIYEENNDLIGWLLIEHTNINYPVMQTLEDEVYYLRRDFYGKKNDNGCLIMDTDSVVGVGISENDYKNGIKPSSNLIIHGHRMDSGEMFGKLNLYRDETYGMEHNIIYFDSLYEKRKYELIAVFYSQVFYEKQEVFKYYKFFQANTQEEFNDWYYNIKEMSLYDTGVTAKFGDEFITLSCCSYHTEDGRFVVVGKRVYD